MPLHHVFVQLRTQEQKFDPLLLIPAPGTKFDPFPLGSTHAVGHQQFWRLDVEPIPRLFPL